LEVEDNDDGGDRNESTIQKFRQLFSFSSTGTARKWKKVLYGMGE
jgi:hypothetical protein